MSIRIRITDDFDLEKIASSGQCFRWVRIAKDSYRILHGKRCVYVESLQEQWYSFSCDEKEFAAVWTDYFDFQENYAGIRSRIDKGEDPFLWLAAEHERGIRILRQEPWEILVTFIISQNKNIP
ncbi:MAG: 8-oxoguanine DNA glycosylase, N-terminal domain-containing protein, partial [Aeriscardovia sp.]|nr:8-oxoguanine DNA glycosylase, N-terminal domain-containing protein [Aeriscardovia sp.]